MENHDDVQIVWLDAGINDTDVTVLTKSVLLECNATAYFDANLDRGLEFMRSISTEYIILIVSPDFFQQNVTEIRGLHMVIAICLFSIDQEISKSSIIQNNESKITVIQNHRCLKEVMLRHIRHVEKQVLNMTLFDQSQKAMKDLSKESASFLWHQLLIHVLKQMDADPQSKEQMLQLCTEFYQTNPIELRKIEVFRHTYRPENAINWYTAECFLYKLLNKILRSEDFKLLYTFRFFIIDLSNALIRQRNHWEGGNSVLLYRGQQLSTDEFKKFRENIGATVAMHGFLSTSRGKDVAIAYAGKPSNSGHQVSVLFEISADPSQPSIIFADIANQSRVEDEQEVLFNLNTLFKITSVEFEPNQELWTIHLATVDDDLKRTKVYLETLQNQMIGYSPMINFGRILLVELGQTERAMDYFHVLLQTLSPDHADLPAVYNGLGHVNYAKHDFDEALKNFLIAYNMRQKSLPPDHPHIAGSLDNIGNIYREKNNFDQALEYYSKAAAIHERYHSGDHMKKARSLQNIACMHWKKHELDTALEILNSVLAMYNRLISAEHPEVVECLEDIGLIYDEKRDFATALAYYERQLKIGDVCFPADHPALENCISSIVKVYRKMNNFRQAMEFCAERIDYQQLVVGDDHPSVARLKSILTDLQLNTD